MRASAAVSPLPALTHSDPIWASGRTATNTGTPTRSSRVISVTRLMPSWAAMPCTRDSVVSMATSR